MSNSDVFQVVTYPAAPGTCRTCGIPFGKRILVDTGLTGDFCNRPHWNPHTEQPENEVDMNTAGTIYFCESCVVNMGMVVGMIDQPKAKLLRQEKDAADELIMELRQQILGYKEIIDGYHSLGFDPSDISNPSVVTSDVSDEQIPFDSTEQSEPTTVESLQGTSVGEPEINQPEFSGRESGDVSRIDSDESGELGDEPNVKSGGIGF